MLDQLVWFLLSTRTTVANCEAAYSALRTRYPSWGEVREAPDEYVGACLRPAGLFRSRAANLKAAIAVIEKRFGEPSLEALRSWSDEEAESFLRSLPGVGLKVARCVLAFGLGRSSFAVDAHIWRISRRLGWHDLPGEAPSEWGADRIQSVARTAPDPLSLHVNLIRLGREFCPAGSPRCEPCPLARLCPTAAEIDATPVAEAEALGRPALLETVERGPKLAVVRVLMREYAAFLDVDLGFQRFEEELAELPGDYAPPRGTILLASIPATNGSAAGGTAANGVVEPAGCVALRPLDEDSCEMKRLFVRPEYRGYGLGRALAERVIEIALDRGYRRMRLDTLERLVGAVGLYRSLGFRRIDPYYENPLPGAMFWEKRLEQPRSAGRIDGSRADTKH